MALDDVRWRGRFGEYWLTDDIGSEPEYVQFLQIIIFGNLFAELLYAVQSHQMKGILDLVLASGVWGYTKNGVVKGDGARHTASWNPVTG